MTGFFIQEDCPFSPTFILSFQFFKKPSKLNVSIGFQEEKTSPSYTYNKSFLIGPLITEGPRF